MVEVYISEHLIYQHRQNLQSDLYEHIWVDIKIKNVSFAINAFYRPPTETAESHNTFLQTAENILSRLSSYNTTHKIIASDLNFGNCYCKYPILNPKPLDTRAPDLFSSYGFSQLIDIPTRVTHNTTSLIDLIFEFNTDSVVCHGTLPQIADHDGVLVSYIITTQKPKPKSKQIYDYKNADVNGLIQYIKDFDFNTAVFSHPTVAQAELYSNILMNAFSLFVPCKTVLIRTNDQPWSNSYTQLLLGRKKRNYQFYKKAAADYNNLLRQPNTNQITLTRYLSKKNNAFAKARNSANESTKANRSVKFAFYNSVNSTMNNCSISPKTNSVFCLG